MHKSIVTEIVGLVDIVSSRIDEFHCRHLEDMDTIMRLLFELGITADQVRDARMRSVATIDQIVAEVANKEKSNDND